MACGSGAISALRSGTLAFLVGVLLTFLPSTLSAKRDSEDSGKRQEMERLLEKSGSYDGDVLINIAQFVVLPLILVGGLIVLIRRE